MRALLLVGLLVGTAQGAVLDGKTQSVGTLTSAQTATGASANSVKLGMASKARALIVTSRNTAGTATADVQINCTGVAADWASIANGSSALTVSAAAVSVLYPGCEYRVNVSACSTCSVTVSYAIVQ